MTFRVRRSKSKGGTPWNQGFRYQNGHFFTPGHKKVTQNSKKHSDYQKKSLRIEKNTHFWEIEGPMKPPRWGVFCRLALKTCFLMLKVIGFEVDKNHSDYQNITHLSKSMKSVSQEVTKVVIKILSLFMTKSCQQFVYSEWNILYMKLRWRHQSYSIDNWWQFLVLFCDNFLLSSCWE